MNLKHHHHVLFFLVHVLDVGAIRQIVSHLIQQPKKINFKLLNQILITIPGDKILKLEWVQMY